MIFSSSLLSLDLKIDLHGIHYNTVDGRNSAPVDMVNIPLIIYIVLYVPGGAGFLPSRFGPNALFLFITSIGTSVHLPYINLCFCMVNVGKVYPTWIV